MNSLKINESKREDHPPNGPHVDLYDAFAEKPSEKSETLQHLTESANRDGDCDIHACPQCISVPNRYLTCCSFNH